MATYYESTSNQNDVMPGIVSRDSLQECQEGQSLPSSMMMYLDQASSAASYAESGSGNYQMQLNCDEIPSAGSSLSIPSSQGNFSDLLCSHIGETPYDLWREGKNEMSFMQRMSDSGSIQSIGKQIDGRNDLTRDSVNEDSQIGLSTQMENFHTGQNLQGQGLSLSLNTQIPNVAMPLFENRSANLVHSSFISSYPSTSGDGANGTGSSHDDDIAQCGQSGNIGYFPPHNVIKREIGLNYTNPNRLSGLSSIIPTSKYLKVAQQLLDEVVDVRKALKSDTKKQQNFSFSCKVSKDSDEKPMKDSTLQNSEGSKTDPAGELSPANSQDLQNKITELLSMLDEVDRRYKQYYQHMRIVASYFDSIAGSGASKPYTTLALQTISRHFRCVRDAINGHIKVIRSSLGEQETPGNTKEVGISRLRFVEQKLRQQKALHQLGMIQQHAWRPQRGLPETSVTVLRAWLFEHFLHPYPKDADKIVLARQTGLTRGQVSNWFINARVRLWKPMIEDMYKEEIGDSEIDSNSSSDNTPKATTHNIKISNDTGEASQKNAYSATIDDCHIGYQGEDHGQIDRFIAASNAFQMAELGMFGTQGGVSLTLGLQNSDGSNHPSFITMQGDDMFNAVTSSVEPNNAAMNGMGEDDQQYRFGTAHSMIL
ncbi:hypothetical protein ACHQM5_015437 [Ranunculus cassubicifolius]